MKKNILSTLFVGIDVSSKTNVLCALDFQGNKLLNLKVLNNQPGAESILNSIIGCLDSNSLKYAVIALESTSFYSTHIANFLASNELLLAYKPLVYCLNPKTIVNYRKSFVDMDKTDPLDAYIIADFARCGRITSKPWRGAQFLALQRLTRHRLHLIEGVTREKAYMVSNIYLKFSELAVLDKEQRPFSNTYGVTCAAILTEYLSLDDTRMTKTGNKYLRYYLIEAANSVKNHIPEYREYYYKKYGEVTTHQHKRALALVNLFAWFLAC